MNENIDPNRVLARILTLANEIMCLPEGEAANAEGVEALAAGLLDLHDHICEGGVLPEKWTNGKTRGS